EYGTGIEEGHDPDPGGIHCTRRGGHERGDAENEDAVVRDVVSHELGTEIIVADRLQYGANARMGESARDQKERDSDGRHKPKEWRADIVGVVGYAVEAARVRLILDNELLKDERFGQCDDCAVHAINVPLECDDPENESEKCGDHQSEKHCNGR